MSARVYRWLLMNMSACPIFARWEGTMLPGMQDTAARGRRTCPVPTGPMRTNTELALRSGYLSKRGEILCRCEARRKGRLKHQAQLDCGRSSWPPSFHRIALAGAVSARDHASGPRSDRPLAVLARIAS